MSNPYSNRRRRSAAKHARAGAYEGCVGVAWPHVAIARKAKVRIRLIGWKGSSTAVGRDMISHKMPRGWSAREKFSV